MKNSKGFTLIELLAVIVILGVIFAIVIRSVTVSMNDAKKETEKVFISKIEDSIEQYIDSNKRTFVKDPSFEEKTITKKTSSDGLKKKDVKVIKLLKRNNDDIRNEIRFKDIIDTGFIKESDLVNPANEKKCSVTSTIDIYRDEDFVYYYKTNLDCIDTKDKNGDDTYDINTWPTLNDKKNEELEESGEEE